MERKQFFTTCRYCGKQILMTRNVDNGKFTPCDPTVIWFFPDEDCKEGFVDEDGRFVFGYASDTMWHVGYRKHSMTCGKRNSA